MTTPTYTQSDLEALRERCAARLENRAQVLAQVNPDWLTAIDELLTAANILRSLPLTLQTEEGTK